MKKLIGTLFWIFSILSLQAQSKVSKAAVIGKWSLVSVEVPEQVYYNTEKDSISLNETIKKTASADQVAILAGMLKQQLGIYAKMSFQFNTDGTVEMRVGDDTKTGATYRIDEEKSMIITKEKDTAEVSLKAEILPDNTLRIFTEEEKTKVFLVFRKNK
jgi:hypothetical protein